MSVVTAEEQTAVGTKGGAKRRNPLSQTCMLVVLETTGWDGYRIDPAGADIIARQTGQARAQSRAGYYLCDPAAFKGLAAARTHVGKVFATRTLPWLSDGTRIVRNIARASFDAEMIAAITRWESEADTLAARYPSLMVAGMAALAGRATRAEYPSPGTFRDLFRARIRTLPFPDASDFRVDGLDAGLTAHVKAQLEELPDSIGRDAAREIATRVVGRCRLIAEGLRRYPGRGKGKAGTFHESLLEAGRTLASLVPMLNIHNDETMAAVGEDLAALCAPDVDAVKDADPKVRADMAASADAIVDRMSAFL